MATYNVSEQCPHCREYVESEMDSHTGETVATEHCQCSLKARQLEDAIAEIKLYLDQYSQQKNLEEIVEAYESQFGEIDIQEYKAMTYEKETGLTSPEAAGFKPTMSMSLDGKLTVYDEKEEDHE